MPALIKAPAYFATRQLEARDYTVDPTLTGSPVTIASAPSYAVAQVRGRVLGPAGAYAMFGDGVQVFQSAPSALGYQDGAVVVPCGEKFEFTINMNQSICALASVSPQVAWGSPSTIVIVTYHVFYDELGRLFEDKVVDVVGGKPGGPSSPFIGPPVGWSK